MALTKKDLVKIKDVVLEIMEPMMIANQNEFSKIDDKFAKIDDKFAKVDDKFAKIDDKFAKVGSRFSKIDKRLDGIDKEIKEKFDKVLDGQDKILKTMEDLKSDNTAGSESEKRQEEKLENHEIRIKMVEKKMAISAQ